MPRSAAEMSILLGRASRRVLERIANHRARADADGNRAVVRMLEVIEERFLEPGFGVEAMLARCGGIGRELNADFCAYTGELWGRFIEGCRIEIGAYLLQRTSLPIWQVSELSGYRTVGTFSRAFGRRMGRRPTDYRAMSRTAEWVSATAFSGLGSVEPTEVLEGRLEPEQAVALLERILELYPEAAASEITRAAPTHRLHGGYCGEVAATGIELVAQG